MLYIIPTPIWNKEDISLRALRLFKELNMFICEDTRTFKNLLSMYEIDYKNKIFYSLTSFTEQWKIKHYLNLLSDNDIWLVSEAGTPWLSDPGKNLIKLCNENKIKYTILPWTNALIPAVVASGFDTSSFVFLGFLPQKKWRQTILKQIIKWKEESKKFGMRWEKIPVFFYESVHRFEKLLKELKELNFEWKISISREISKMFEQIITTNLDEIIDLVKTKKLPIKWEFVVGLY